MALRSNKESIGMAAMQAMLRMDPLAAAEKVTSASYKEDEATEQLGLVFAIMHNRKKREMLEAAGDTYGHMSFGAYLSVIVDMGFEHQLADPFGKEGDVFYIFYRKPGLILAFDTYRGRSINGGKLYYNWRQKRKMPPSCFSSGGWRPRTPEIEKSWMHSGVSGENCGGQIQSRRPRKRPIKHTRAAGMPSRLRAAWCG